MSRDPFWTEGNAQSVRFYIDYALESNITLYSSTSFGASGHYIGRLGTNNSLDMIGVELQNGASYNLVLQGEMPSRLRIYDNEGYHLYAVDGESAGYEEPYGVDTIARFQPTYTGTHYLSIEWEYGGSASGNYAVVIGSDDHVVAASTNSPATGTIGITGEAIQGATLTADTTSLIDGNGLGALEYRWTRDGDSILGANFESYQLTRSDIGSAISVTVVYIDGDGFLEVVTSTATDTVRGSDAASVGNDMFYGEAESGIFNGLAGIDTLVLPITRSQSDLTLSSDSSNGMINDGGISYEFSNIERLQFTDTNIAFDLLNDGHAGQVCKILGAVYGADAIENPAFVGTGLSLLDGGMSYEGLAEAAISLRGYTDHQNIAELLWTNLVGHAPKNAQVAPYVEMLDSGSLSVGGLVSIAANHELNTQNIDLTGLASTGIEYQLA